MLCIGPRLRPLHIIQRCRLSGHLRAVFIICSCVASALFMFIAVIIAVVAIAGTVAGCAYFTQENVAAIHKTEGTVLDVAYTSGGATLVEQKIDAMVADGKITAEQAVQLKAAAQKSYSDLQNRLSELAVKDVTVENAE